MKRVSLALALLLFPAVAMARLEGLAQVVLPDMSPPVQMTTAAKITMHRARFFQIDEFGNVGATLAVSQQDVLVQNAMGGKVYEIKKGLKRIFKLPLARQTLLDVLNGAKPKGALEVPLENGMLWGLPDKKIRIWLDTPLVVQSDDGQTLPYWQNILIEDGEHRVQISWQSLKLH